MGFFYKSFSITISLCVLAFIAVISVVTISFLESYVNLEIVNWMQRFL